MSFVYRMFLFYAQISMGRLETEEPFPFFNKLWWFVEIREETHKIVAKQLAEE